MTITQAEMATAWDKIEMGEERALIDIDEQFMTDAHNKEIAHYRRRLAKLRQAELDSGCGTGYRRFQEFRKATFWGNGGE